MTAVFILYVVLIALALPCGLVWGWVRWSRGEKSWSLIAIFSFGGLVLATVSALLALAAYVY
ncbi:MAG: hypothetical protein WA294_17895 [Acidobacteriaceae bacterium]